MKTSNLLILALGGFVVYYLFKSKNVSPSDSGFVGGGTTPIASSPTIPTPTYIPAPKNVKTPTTPNVSIPAETFEKLNKTSPIVRNEIKTGGGGSVRITQTALQASGIMPKVPSYASEGGVDAHLKALNKVRYG